MKKKLVKVIVTLGPATKSESDLAAMKARGVDFVRINMSHSSLDDLMYFINLANKVNIPFILDTEGPQVRSGFLSTDQIHLRESDRIKIFAKNIVGTNGAVSLRPRDAFEYLEEGDILYLDFGTLILRIVDTCSITDGYVVAQAVSAGQLGQNKAVLIDSAKNNDLRLPLLSEKDYQSITLGLKHNVEYIAASYLRAAEDVDEVRQATRNKMKIITKIENQEALTNLIGIIEKTDIILIDRGDLSKEIPIEKVPFSQKMIIDQAMGKNKDVFVATNFLETMIDKSKPTRAEVQDVISTILDGARGLMLSAETAIGHYPIQCINMLNTLIDHAGLAIKSYGVEKKESKFIENLKSSNYLTDTNFLSLLTPPHGGVLINRVLKSKPDKDYLQSLPKIEINSNTQMDLEQIAIGSFSPLQGFMGKDDLQSVLDDTRLRDGTIWPVPVLLDVAQDEADKLNVGDDVALMTAEGVMMAILHLEEKYEFDKLEVVEKLYQTADQRHPGVKAVMDMKPVFLAGTIDLIEKRKSENKEYELTPEQVRRLFRERGWSRVVGFHTRNAIHRSHEYIQLKALELACADGLFIHPVVGRKKSGDFQSRYIIKSYEMMMQNIYPRNKVVFAVFSTFSRYAGPREALFTALCRKNFGCSHFIVGRDHTGVGEFYHHKASHKIFDQFPDLGIEPIKFDTVFYSKKRNHYMLETDEPDHPESDKLSISGTQARAMLEKGKLPPDWFMRQEISKIIINSLIKGEEVFVSDQDDLGKVIWFTGLSGSGKTTIAEKLRKKLMNGGYSVVVFDGDVMRANKHAHLGFSRDGIKENNRLMAELAKQNSLYADFIIVSIISPYKADRDMARTIIGKNFNEVYVRCSLGECIQRDPKGLYKKAQAGTIRNMIGYNKSNPYHVPQNPELEVPTDKFSVDESVDKIIDYLKKKYYGFKK